MHHVLLSMADTFGVCVWGQCGTTLVMGGTLAALTKGLHRAERQSRRTHIVFMAYYVLATVGAIVAAVAAFVVRPPLPLSLVHRGWPVSRSVLSN